MSRICLLLTVTLMISSQWDLLSAADPAQITEARIRSLPKGAQPSWEEYWKRSKGQSQLDHEWMDMELKAEGAKSSTPAVGANDFKFDSKKPREWFGSQEAKELAARIVSYQTPSGGWSKHLDYGQARKKGQRYSSGEGWSYVATFDNGATITELRFLAKVHHETRDPLLEVAILKGMRFVESAQFPNGGWPQVYPLAGGYHDAITYNDNAMVNILELLREVIEKQEDFVFFSGTARKSAEECFKKGIECTLATQQSEDGKLTVWGQQHDAITLKPTSARAYEMISNCSSESARIMGLLMTLKSPSPEVVRAVHGASAWFEKTAIHGFEWKSVEGDRKLVPKEGAGPLWSRYYQLGTDKPIFGDRDQSIHFDVAEISKERRNGYSWYNAGAQGVLRECENWKQSHPMLPSKSGF
jgi:PelA/Pel-15E family pectate lyase